MDTTPWPPGPAAGPDDALARACSPREQRQRWIAAGVVVMVVLSVIAAVIVLADMNGASAAVTGGCGGG
jgi:hypothetical protein